MTRVMQWTKYSGEPKLVCPNCSVQFTKMKSNQTHCSSKCRREVEKKLRLTVNKMSFASLGRGRVTTGAVSELVVAIGLLRAGYDVFRAIASCSDADLVAISGNRILRIQVTTGYRDSRGKLGYDPHAGGGHDVIAIVERGDVVTYIPALVELEKVA